MGAEQYERRTSAYCSAPIVLPIKHQMFYDEMAKRSGGKKMDTRETIDHYFKAAIFLPLHFFAFLLVASGNVTGLKLSHPCCAVSPLTGLSFCFPESRGTNLSVGARPWLLPAAPAGADARLRRKPRFVLGTKPALITTNRILYNSLDVEPGGGTDWGLIDVQ